MSIGKRGFSLSSISTYTFPRSSSDSVNALFHHIDTSKFLRKHLTYLFQGLTLLLSDTVANLLNVYQVLLAFHLATIIACVFQAVGHLPLLALEVLLNLLHRQCADPCTVALNTLVFTTGATFLDLAAVSVPYARNSLIFHS